MNKLAVVFLIIFPKLVYVLIVSSKIFSPSKFESKIVPTPPPPPLCFPPLKFRNLVLPFFVVAPIDLQYSSFSPPKIFNLRITGYKLTTNMLSNCVISCNTQEQKQASRSKLIFQIHKQKQSYTQLQGIAHQGIGNSVYFKQKIFCL